MIRTIISVLGQFCGHRLWTPFTASRFMLRVIWYIRHKTIKYLKFGIDHYLFKVCRHFIFLSLIVSFCFLASFFLILFFFSLAVDNQQPYRHFLDLLVSWIWAAGKDPSAASGSLLFHYHFPLRFWKWKHNTQKTEEKSWLINTQSEFRNNASLNHVQLNKWFLLRGIMWKHSLHLY